MPQIIIQYDLKSNVTPDQFETWVRDRDQPTMRGLTSVTQFRTFKLTGLLMGESTPPAAYIEVFDIADMAAFTGTDMPGDVVQAIMGEFMGFVDNPRFLTAVEIA